MLKRAFLGLKLEFFFFGKGGGDEYLHLKILFQSGLVHHPIAPFGAGAHKPLVHGNRTVNRYWMSNILCLIFIDILRGVAFITELLYVPHSCSKHCGGLKKD